MASIKPIATVQTEDRNFNQFQSNIAQAVNPVIMNPLVQGNLIKSVSLEIGSNTVNTNLNSPLQGWVIVRQRASAMIYDSQDSNAQPAQSLVLISSAPVVVDLYVF